MLNDLEVAKFDHVYICCGRSDLRKGIDGLVAIISENMKLDPFSHSLFLFCGSRKDRIKAITYEGDGFLLCYKRVACGSFHWPRNPEEARNLTQEDFDLLMHGRDIEPGIRKFKPSII